MPNVQLVNPDPDWEKQARLEADRFRHALGDDPRLVAIHHIGSTSIPGIQAKPTLDLMPEVTSLDLIDERRAQIEAAGYQFWGEYGISNRRFCPRLAPDGQRIANVHCFPQGDGGLTRHLAFRDFLRAHPNQARSYEQVKQRCAALQPDDVNLYNDCKNHWIKTTEGAALRWLRATNPPPISDPA